MPSAPRPRGVRALPALRAPHLPGCQRPAAGRISASTAWRALTVRSARTVFGGAVTDGRPVATMTIIGTCVAVFVLQQVVPGLTGAGGVRAGARPRGALAFLTSAFAHSPSSLPHRVQHVRPVDHGHVPRASLGRARFVAVYLLSAVGGSVVYLLCLAAHRRAGGGRRGQGLVRGCRRRVRSGFGLFGAFLVLQRRLGRPAAGMYVTMYINAVIGFVIPAIAWQAHLSAGCSPGRRQRHPSPTSGAGRGPAQPPNRSVHWVGLAGITGILLHSSCSSTRWCDPSAGRLRRH